MNADNELLCRYADHGDERAFAELVEAKIHLVYSAALRQVGGNTHQAEDVTEGVFVVLAAQARRLREHPTLTAWLYTTTRNVAAKSARTDTRWRRREREANAMPELPTTIESVWSDLRPIIDDAMNDLPSADRAALLHRFFESRSHAEIGAMIGLSENAARMRVERALDKLRVQLARRGITSTAALISGALAANAVQAAPVSLSSSVAANAVSTAGALAAAAGAGNSPLALTLMSTTKLTCATAAAVVLFAAGTYVGVRSSSTFSRAPSPAGQSEEFSKLAQENGRLRAELARLTAPAVKNATAGNARSRTKAGPSDTREGNASLGEPRISADTVSSLAGKWQILAQLQKDRVVQSRLALIDGKGRLSDAAVSVFDVNPAEREALAQAVDVARQKLETLERQNAVISTPAPGKISIHEEPFPEPGGAIYDALMKSFADTLGPERNAAFVQLAGTQVDQSFAQFGAESRTVTVTSQPDSTHSRYLVTDEQVSAGSHGTSSGNFKSRDELMSRFGTIINLLPPDF